MMNEAQATAGSARRYEIVFGPETSARVSRYVVRGFFGPHELPQALARMLLTGEFGVFVAIPLALLVLSRFVPEETLGGRGLDISLGLIVLSTLWLIVGLARIASYGRSAGIGCFELDGEGRRAALVGGLRMRLERGRRVIWIAGLLVEPRARGARIGTALILAAFRLAMREAASGPVVLAVFAPSHPASKAIVASQLGGAQEVMLATPLPEHARQTIERLEAALTKENIRLSLASEASSLFA